MDTLIKTLETKDFEIRENVSFKTLTTYKTGGICKYLVSPKNVEYLIELIKILKNSNINYKILGNGSNVLVSDDTFNGVVIKLNKLNDLEINGMTVTMGAGHSLISLALTCSNKGLSGLEWASGIPGTVGGAVYMNAGAYLKSVSDSLIEIKALDNELNVVTIKKEKLGFGYRKSNLMENKFIVLSASFMLEDGEKDEILKVIKDRKERRMSSQPLEYPSAGSVFRNPEGDYAGRLVEECGLKGKTIGGAQISEKHANFVINKGNATSNDIKELIELAKSEVYKKFNIELKVEQEFFNWE